MEGPVEQIIPRKLVSKSTSSSETCGQRLANHNSRRPSSVDLIPTLTAKANIPQDIAGTKANPLQELAGAKAKTEPAHVKSKRHGVPTSASDKLLNSGKSQRKTKSLAKKAWT